MGGADTIELRVLHPGRGAFFLAEDGKGRVLRVHGGLPGERVLARERPGDPGFADVVEVLDPSPDRVPPPCPLAPRCGGCGWLSLAPRAQLALRLDGLRRALAGAGSPPPDEEPVRVEVLPAPATLGYRWRLRFQAALDREPPAIGFHRPGSRRVLDVAACPLAAPPLGHLYRDVRRQLLAERPRDLTGLELSTLPGARGGLLFLNPRDRPPASWPGLGERLLAAIPRLAGVAVRPPSPRSPARPGFPDLLGSPLVLGRLPSGAPVAVAARGFLQGNLPAADRLADLVARLADPAAGARVLDLHAGAGLLSWRLAARGGDVLAIEVDRLAAAAAAALPSPPAGSLRVRPGRAEEAGEAIRHAEVVVTDPPRSGLGALAGTLAREGPPRLVLVSCSVEALARDLPRLREGGYRVDRLVAVDLFPHTRHLEVVTLLRRPSSPSQSW